MKQQSAMSLTVEQLVSRMTWAARHDLDELELTIGSARVTIRRGAADRCPAAPVTIAKNSPPDAQAGADMVTAPLAGLCHLAPEPGSAPFVKAGDMVEAGQTLCIIEAMKMMTPVTAAKPGRVDSVLAQDGASVDAGAPLMRIA